MRWLFVLTDDAGTGQQTADDAAVTGDYIAPAPCGCCLHNRHLRKSNVPRRATTPLIAAHETKRTEPTETTPVSRVSLINPIIRIHTAMAHYAKDRTAIHRKNYNHFQPQPPHTRYGAYRFGKCNHTRHCDHTKKIAIQQAVSRDHNIAKRGPKLRTYSNCSRTNTKRLTTFAACGRDVIHPH